ncbi:conjugal transfer protein TraD [Rhizomicrobium electricum]|nr:conjugal transfer protein TraD [Rhizomicrobium electricum]NIJ49760.1 cell shape-determining protein MreC [Rhizomicrobium electricum]
MRKPRDFDAALKTLTEKTKALKENKRKQLGDLIVATGADALDVETLAGALIATVQSVDTAQKQAWKKAGTEFFRKTKAAQSADTSQPESAQTSDSLFASSRSGAGKS